MSGRQRLHLEHFGRVVYGSTTPISKRQHNVRSRHDHGLVDRRLRATTRRTVRCSFACSLGAPVVGSRATPCCCVRTAARGRPSDVPLLCRGGGGFGGGRIAAAEEQPGDFSQSQEGHVRADARCRRPPSLTCDAAGVPRRPAAAQQGDALSRGSADDRGDRDGHAPRRRHCPRCATARPDRRAVAGRPADPRGAGARRGRPGRAPRTAAGAARRGRPAPRGRHGRLGVGAAEPWLQARVVLSGDNAEIIDTVHARRAPIVPVDSSLAL